MRVAETSGRTVDEAIGRALDQLGLRRDQVDVDVITEGKAGFLGFGSEDAIVRVTAKDSVLTTPGSRGGNRGRRGGRGGRGGRGRQDIDSGGRPERAEPAVREDDDDEDDSRPARGNEREPLPARASDDGPERGPRPRGRRGGRGRGGEGRPQERPERGGARPSRPREDVRSVSVSEQVRIPGTPDDLPKAPNPEAADDVDLAGSTLRDLLTLLGLTATEITARDPETPGDGVGLIEQIFDIYGEDDDTSDDLGVLIGRRGETLQSLQYLVNTIVAKSGNKPPVFGLDIEGYRRRREQMLVDLAKEIAQEVRETGDVITLEPMPAAERRIVHLALESEAGVRTESVGSGDRRQVEVLPE